MEGNWSPVILSVAVFVVGEFLVKLFVEPIIELRRTIGEVRHAVKFYANVYVNPPLGREASLAEIERIQVASNRFRDLAMELDSKHAVILLPNFAGTIGLIPMPEKIEDARGELVFLSNATGRENGLLCDLHARRLLTGLRMATEEDGRCLKQLEGMKEHLTR